MYKYLLLTLFLLLPLTIFAVDQESNVDFSAVDGKKVRNIFIKVNDIFDGDRLNRLYQEINSIKVNTREYVIKQELLFKVDETINALMVRESARQLRSLRYIREVKIVPKVEGEFVDIYVDVQDTWTLIPQATVSAGDGQTNTSFGLEDSNFLGFGNRVEVTAGRTLGNSSFEAVYDDRRVLGSNYNTVAGYFNRVDLERKYLLIEKPIRTLLDKDAWQFQLDSVDEIGRLWYANEEQFIFGHNYDDYNLSYTFTKGSPDEHLHRYSLGYGYRNDTFSMADAEDYKNLDIDPNTISQDPDLLATNRRFVGPTFNYSYIEANYIPLNYIDRFDRFEDYNLGKQFISGGKIAPKFLGSIDDAVLFTLAPSRGFKLSDTQYLRGEMNFSTRFGESSFENTILSSELRYYNLLGSRRLLGLNLGRHTLASAFDLDYGYDLDKEVQFLAGGDNAIRGYEARTLSGNKRFIFNLEDRFTIAEDVLKLMTVGAAFFFDAGAASNDSFGDLLGKEVYSNVGAGLRLAFPRSSGGRVLRFDVSFPLRNGPDGTETGEPRFIIAGGQIFNSFLSSEINRNNPSVSGLYNLGN